MRNEKMISVCVYMRFVVVVDTKIFVRSLLSAVQHRSILYKMEWNKLSIHATYKFDELVCEAQHTITRILSRFTIHTETLCP